MSKELMLQNLPTSAEHDSSNRSVVQKGETNVYIASVENFNHNVTNNIESHTTPLLYPPYINTSFFNLFVIDRHDFKVGLSTMGTTISKHFTSPEIAEKFFEFDSEKKREMKTYPSLFIPTPIYEDGKPSYDQYGYIGFIDNYETRYGSGTLTWHWINKLPLRHIQSYHDIFGLLDMDQTITEMDVPHWSIKQIDLLHVVTNSMLLTLPSIPNKDLMLPVLRVTEGTAHSTQEYTLEFTNYYYCENDKANTTKITKTIYIPNFSHKRWWHKKTNTLVFNERDVRTNSDFTNSLPTISLLTNFIPKMPFHNSQDKMSNQYVPKIAPVQVILGSNLNWEYYDVREEGDHLAVFPPNFQSEAADPDQAIGELIEALIHWLLTTDKVNAPAMQEIKDYIESLK